MVMATYDLRSKLRHHTEMLQRQMIYDPSREVYVGTDGLSIAEANPTVSPEITRPSDKSKLLLLCEG